jgi:hypothetical protein
MARAKKASEVAHEELVKQAIIPIGRFEGLRETPLARLVYQLLLTLVGQNSIWK